MNVKMKNTFKNILILAAAVFGLAACQEEVADVQGVVGDFAYIVDGTEAKYAGTTCEVFHTPIGEMGEVAATVTVALTKVQKTDVNIVLTVDDSALDGGYDAFPAGVLKFNENVTIPAGEKTAEVAVTVANADFAKLVELKYQAIFRIASASGVKISSNSNAAYLMVLTETINPADNIINVASSTSTFEIKQYHGEDDSIETVAANITKNITIEGTEPAFLPFEVSLAHAPELVAAYNEANGTNYEVAPEGLVTVGADPVIKAGEGYVLYPVTVNTSVLTDPETGLIKRDWEGYVVPLKISGMSVDGVKLSNDLTYVVVKGLEPIPPQLFTRQWGIFATSSAISLWTISTSTYHSQQADRQSLRL